MEIKLYEKGNTTYNRKFIELLIECIYDESLISDIEKQLNLVSGSLKRYFEYFRYLRNNFDIGSNIIEVGYGDLPIVSLLIDSEQKRIGSGTITAFEKRKNRVNMPDGYETIVLKERFITNDSLLDTCDLLIGVYPCEGMLSMIDAAKIHAIEYCIAICSCFRNEYERVYKNAIIRNSQQFNVSLDKNYSKDLPLLIRKRK